MLERFQSFSPSKLCHLDRSVLFRSTEENAEWRDRAFPAATPTLKPLYGFWAACGALCISYIFGIARAVSRLL